MEHFDRNRNGQVDFDEFLRALRVNITYLFVKYVSIGRYQSTKIEIH